MYLSKSTNKFIWKTMLLQRSLSYKCYVFDLFDQTGSRWWKVYLVTQKDQYTGNQGNFKSYLLFCQDNLRINNSRQKNHFYVQGYIVCVLLDEGIRSYLFFYPTSVLIKLSIKQITDATLFYSAKCWSCYGIGIASLILTFICSRTKITISATQTLIRYLWLLKLKVTSNTLMHAIIYQNVYQQTQIICCDVRHTFVIIV